MSIPDTLISLIVAFVIAMAFRGFVLEGFVIPTGSMAPTLLGDHMILHSQDTGYEWTVDTGPRFLGNLYPGQMLTARDPMMGPAARLQRISAAELPLRSRSGDRVLVMKWLPLLMRLDRFDVVVFKNPTNPTENYIKRLVGLPNEEVWLVDGDVFVRALDADPDAPFRICRKPAHVQRAVWQPIHDSHFLPSANAFGRPDQELWLGLTRNDESWSIEPGDQTLSWNARAWPLRDTNAYNMLGETDEAFEISDLRIMMQLTPDDADFAGTLLLRARTHVFEFDIQPQQIAVRMWKIGSPDAVTERRVARPATVPGEVIFVECVHVDQELLLNVNDTRVALAYEWDPDDRLLFSTGRSVQAAKEESYAAQPWVRDIRPHAAELEWKFRGGGGTIHRLRVDRDLYYRPDIMSYDWPDPAVATHPDATAHLGDSHYFMCGDNSAASLDSRKWGQPHELVAKQIDPTGFVVHRKLIVGRAWCVYFPSPYALREGGTRFVPDFGHMRLIR